MRTKDFRIVLHSQVFQTLHGVVAFDWIEVKTGNDHAIQILLRVCGISSKQHRSPVRQLHQKAVMPGSVTMRLKQANAFGNLLIADECLERRCRDFGPR